jgi:4-hydroxybenzoate polyprenyltransferase
VHLRLFLLTARPAVLLLMALSAALGTAAAGRANDVAPLAHALVVVLGYVVAAVAVNDLSDVAADRANAAHLGHRPLVAGTARPRQLVAVAAAGAVVALAAAAAAGPLCAVVVAVGLVLACGHSLPPARFATRGVVGPLVLPAGFVAVPFLAGVCAAGPDRVTARQLALLGGLWLGFVGRLVLKDFRDVRGDAMVGKRTFLVRRGRGAACAVSAVAWVAGSVALVAVDRIDAVTAAAFTGLAAVAVLLVRALAGSRDRPADHHADDRLVAAVAICGRGQLLVLVVHLAAVQAGTPDAARAAIVALLAVSTAGLALATAVLGPMVAGVAAGVSAASLPAPPAPPARHPRPSGARS